eukprot:scaffold279262_cov36-Prasinocladus_malaysianus.AAC.1
MPWQSATSTHGCPSRPAPGHASACSCPSQRPRSPWPCWYPGTPSDSTSPPGSALTSLKSSPS